MTTRDLTSLPAHASTPESDETTQQPGTPAPGGAAAAALMDLLAEETGTPAQPALPSSSPAGGAVAAQPTVPASASQQPGTQPRGHHPKR